MLNVVQNDFSALAVSSYALPDRGGSNHGLRDMRQP